MFLLPILLILIKPLDLIQSFQLLHLILSLILDLLVWNPWFWILSPKLITRIVNDWWVLHLLLQTEFLLRLSISFFLSFFQSLEDLPVFIMKLISFQVLLLLYFLKVDHRMILQIILPYLSYQFFFFFNPCFLDFWILLTLNIFHDF